MEDLELKLIAFQVLGPLGSVIAFAPLVLYLVARWRASRAPVQDPQLGLKFALYYFATASLQLALAGITMLAYAMIKPGPSDPDGDMYRVALGFILPSGAVLGAHIALLLRTNDRQHPGVRRLFVGFNLMITGIMGFGALVLGAQALFTKGSTDGMGHFAGAAILVYCTTWGLLVWQLDFLTIGKSRFGADEPPANIVPPGPPAEPPAGAGGGLPSLGGGAYPPIDGPGGG